MSESKRDSRFISRRQILQMMGAGLAAAALAACQPTTTPPAANTPATTGQAGNTPAAAGNTPAAGGTTPAAAGNTPAAGGTTPAAAGATATTGTSAANTPAAVVQAKGEFHGGWPYTPTPTGHFNQYASGSVAVGNVYHDLVMLPLGMFRWQERKWTKFLASDWKFDGDNFVVTLRPDAKWDDGSPFTAKDVVTSAIINKVYSGVLWKYVDKVEAKGNDTVTFHMNKPSSTVERYVIRNLRITKDATWNQFATKANDIYNGGKDNTSDDIKNLRTAIEALRPKNFDSTGPYMYDPASITEAQMTLVRNEQSFIKSAAVGKIVVFNGETEAVTPIVLSKQGDYMTHGFPVATDQAFQAAGIRVIRPPTHGGGSLLLNEGKVKAFQDKRIRQAIAYAINKETNSKVTYDKSGKAPQYMAGISYTILPGWFSDADTAKLNSYTFDTAKADQLMTAAGCKKGSDGVYLDPDGKPMTYELAATQEFLDNMASAQDAADQLTKFGIKTTLRAVPMAQFPTDRQNGNFQMNISGWGSGDPHPSFSLRATYLNYTANSTQPTFVGGQYPTKQKTDVVGDVDLDQLITDSALGLDQEKQKADIVKAALAVNELMCNIPLYERFGNNPALNGVRVTWPPDSDPLYQNDPYNDSFVTMWLADGSIKPV